MKCKLDGWIYHPTNCHVTEWWGGFSLNEPLANHVLFCITLPHVSFYLLVYVCMFCSFYVCIITCRYAQYDDAFKNEKRIENYKYSLSLQNMSPTRQQDTMLDWLDRLTLAQLQQSQSAAGGLSSSSSVNNNKNKCSNAEEESTESQDLHSFALLVVDLPLFPHKVLFEERCAPAATPHTPLTSLAMLADAGTAYENDKGDTIFEFNLTGRNFSGQALQQVVDWEMEMDADNPCEDMYRRLAHHTLCRGGSDHHIKPNLQEKERLDKILHAPGDHLKTEEKDLLYRFR